MGAREGREANQASRDRPAAGDDKSDAVRAVLRVVSETAILSAG